MSAAVVQGIMTNDVIRIAPRGLNKDLPPHLVGEEPWTDVKNMVFWVGRAVGSLGYFKSTNDPSYTPMDLHYIRIGGQDFWAYMTQQNGVAGIAYWDGLNHQTIAPAGWTQSGAQFQVLDINNVPVFNNVGGNPHYYDASDQTVKPLPNWPSGSPQWNCSFMCAHKNFLFALDVREDTVDFNNCKVRWSDAAPAGSVPGAWQPAANNFAGEAILASPEGPIIGALDLRDTLFIYKENSTHMADFVGGQFVFSVRDGFETIGLIAPRAVVELDNTHIVFTQDDIIRHDGVNIQSIAHNRVRDYIFDNLKSELAERCFLHMDRFNDTIYVFWPDKDAQTGCNRCHLYNFVDDTWGERTFTNGEAMCASTGRYEDDTVEALTWDTWTDPPNTWDGLTGQWNYEAKASAKNRVVFGSTNPQLWKVGGTTDNGAPIPTKLEKIGIDLGHSERFKFVQRVFPNFEEGQGLTVNISVGAGDANGQPVWLPPQPFVIGQDQYVGANISGRAMALRIEGVTTGVWSFTSAEIEFRLGGKF